MKELEVMYENPIYICILDITKVVDFRSKNADFSIAQGVCHVFYIFIGSSLGKV